MREIVNLQAGQCGNQIGAKALPGPSTGADVPSSAEGPASPSVQGTRQMSDTTKKASMWREFLRNLRIDSPEVLPGPSGEARQRPTSPRTRQRSDTFKKASMWHLMWREFFRKRRFETPEVESLYQRYVLQANVTHLTNLLGLLFATTLVLTSGLVFMIISEDSRRGPGSPPIGQIDHTVSLVSNMVCGTIYMGALCFVYWRVVSEKYLVYISYILAATFLLAEISLSRNSPHIWYTVVFIYITYALLPIRLLDATVAGIMLSFVQLPSDLLYGDANVAEYFQNYKSIISNTLILIGMNIMGILTHFPGEMAKRKAFNEIRQFNRARLKITVETKRQQRLMLSVLPRHLVEEMQDDIRSNSNARKLYLMTYDPVSIVFADICGFTAMADKSKADEVVKLLHELYCSFDKLSDVHKCLRIKLLGDCYYCVTGMPRETTYHADLAVSMGLDMIDAIKELREQYKVDLDVRVGIHSGVVQCGVLGLKKWQFDIWGSDVNTANSMESGGIPGKVHISMATKNFLTEQYNFEPGNGASRETALKGIETFFVVSKKPGEVEKMVMEQGRSPRQSRASRVTMLGTTVSTKRSRLTDRSNSMFATTKVVDVEKEVNKSLYSSINSRSIKELKNQNCRKRLLLFRDRNVERKYNTEPDRTLQSYFVTAFIIFFVIGLVQFLKLPQSDLFFVVFGSGFVWVFSVMILVLARKYHSFPTWIRRLSERINKNRRIAQLLSIATIFVCYLATSVPMVFLFKNECTHVRATRQDFVSITNYHIQIWSEDICQNNFLEYTLLYTILVMVIMGTFQVIVFYQKIIVMFIFCSLYCLTITMANPYQSRKEAVVLLFFMVTLLVTFVLLLLIHSQQTEIIQRLDFVWKLQAKSEKDDVERMQENNRRLIENILPEHVAKIYLEKDVKHDDLYSEQKGSVCMLFACITSFSFSEDGNVYVLHDIISDFDEILSQEEFRSLEKIKSTGPIYMAASGLSEITCDIAAMEHVTKMADFALRIRDLMRVLNERHEVTYNIKIGMSVGPVVAGVIGASKPQFDLWGNTVNVASRMYSTGIEGEIQVTDDLAKLLQATNKYSLKERGSVYVKGKGNMYTYFLKDCKRESTSEDPWYRIPFRGVRTSTNSQRPS